MYPVDWRASPRHLFHWYVCMRKRGLEGRGRRRKGGERIRSERKGTNCINAEDCNPDKISGLINFEKRQQLWRVISAFLSYQPIPYNYHKVHQIMVFLKDLKADSGNMYPSLYFIFLFVIFLYVISFISFHF